MVDFNKMVEEQTPPDLTRGYRTVDASSIGDLFSNLGETASSYAKSVQANKQAAAESQETAVANRIADAEHNLFMQEVEGVEELNPGAQASVKRMTKLGKAINMTKGTKRAAFETQLMVEMKKLRQENPNLNINQIAKKVLGYHPGEEGLKILRQAQKDELTEFRQSQNFFIDQAKRTDATGRLAQGMIAANGGQPPQTEEELRRWNAIFYQQEAARAEVENAKELDETTFRTELQADWASRVTPIVLAIRKSGMDMNDPKNREAGLRGVLEMKNQLGAMRAYYQSKYLATVGGDEVEKQMNALDTSIQYIESSITDGKISLATLETNLVALQADRDLNKLRQDPKWGKDIRTLSALKAAGMDNQVVTQAITKLWDGRTQENLADVILSANTAAGSVGLQDAAGVYENIKPGNSQSSQSFRETTKVTMDVLSKSDDPVHIARVVDANYNSSLNDLANKLNKGGSDLITYMTSPAIINNIAKNAPDKLPDVFSATLNAIQNNREFRDEVTEIRRSAPEGKFMMTPTGTLIFEDSKQATIQAWRKDATTAHQVLANKRLALVNTMLKNVENLTTKTGNEWEPVRDTIIRSMGIVVTPTEKEAPGAQKQSSLEDVQITPTSISGSEMVQELYTDTRSVDIAARTIAGEARGESSEGRQAIGEVLRNRALASGKSIAEEARKSWQFSVWNKNDPNRSFVENIDDSNPQYQTAMQDFLSSANSDITKGATHYYNPSVVTPDWADVFVETARIGNHRFGYLREGDPYRAQS